jgi:hypothetical protein
MSEDAPTPATDAVAPNTAIVTLDFDVTQNGVVVIAAGTKIAVKKPMGAALRGTNLGGLIRMDYDQVAIVMPRITTPNLLPATMEIDPADVSQVAGELVDFLLPKRAKEQLFPAT